ncbi:MULTISPECIES: FAD-dependent monooxygenase [Streptomyces]|uniref:Pentachlorophenol monooxygenase n=2 Tax=Streptomyces TaxID=1883 RepID=A0A3S9PLH0_STRLT|nr:FAD-dependent monooxygenase [Streptomyces luteoverticillatus]AZQ73162.1 pentachlorophenol monooxygenase [Streptomyces luteoverticillatus]
MHTTDATTHTDVLIAGAGPTGLVLAVDLARRGIRHRLVDSADRGFPGSRGAGLQPRSLEVFEDLGVLGAMRAAGGPCPPLMVWDGDRQVGEWDMFDRAEPTPAVPYAEIMMLPQWRTVEILAARLEELGGHVDFETGLTGFEQDADGVTATLTRSDGTTETVRARYLVGADGGRSAVRHALGVGFTAEPVDERAALLADVVVDGLERTHWHVWPDAPGGRLALRPLEGVETFQLVARHDDPDARIDPERDGTTEALQRLIEEGTGRSDLTVGEVHWVSAFKPRMAMAERFREGRVFLAGDAAHVHSPAGGQGLNTSIQDGYNLGWKLEAVLRRGAPDSLLDTYATERMGVAADVLGLSTRIHHEDDGGRPRRGPETHQLHVGYPDSPLTRELRHDLPEGALRAGDRAPDAPCEDPASGARVRLFEVFQGTHATVLALGDGEPAVPAVPEWARVFRPVDVDGHVKEAYGSGYFVIRPDGYVGLATDDAGDVAAYLATLTG